MDEEWTEEKAAGQNSAAGLELARRLELQAHCLSGMFVGSIVDSGGPYTQVDFPAVLGNQDRGGKAGNARTHGTSAHHTAWWDQGYREHKIGQCNTWPAPSDDVS